ncbi:unnamed protein product [Colias eurytheme]|nr:unnamed protein product [Colias eurytheme]
MLLLSRQSMNARALSARRASSSSHVEAVVHTAPERARGASGGGAGGGRGGHAAEGDAARRARLIRAASVPRDARV